MSTLINFLNKVPAPGPSFQEPDCSQKVSDHEATTVHVPINPFLDPGDTPLAWPAPAWPTFTDLVQDGDGSYKQTGQIIEINNCLGAAVKRANANLVLIDSFPDIDEQERWLVDALKFGLTAGSQSHAIKAVEEWARVDGNYFHCLLSMVIAGSGAHSHR